MPGGSLSVADCTFVMHFEENATRARPYGLFDSS